MRCFNLLASTACALIMLQAQGASAQASSPEEQQAAPSLGDIIVTARRESENLQNVPVAVSVLTSKQFEVVGSYRPEDLQLSVPGLGIGGIGDTDRANLSFTIRGQGSSYGAIFPAVIQYFNEVPIKSLKVGQFFDADSVQVLRGPQGVQFGRVTDGGNIMFTPRRPTDDYSADISLKYGTYNLAGTSGFANVPIVSDKLMVRLAWDVARRDGFTKNLYNGRDLDDMNYQSVRFSVLWKPSDTFENLTVVQYQHIRDSGTPVLPDNFRAATLQQSLGGTFPLVTTLSDLGLAPPVYGFNANGNIVPWQAGLEPLSVQGVIDRANAQGAAQRAMGPRKVFYTLPLGNRRQDLYLTNTTTASLSDSITLKNVFGYTWLKDASALAFLGDNSGIVASCHTACAWNSSGVPFKNEQQISEELRLSGKFLDGRLNVSIGGYMDEQRPAGPSENANYFGGILEYVLDQRITTKSRAAYGFAEFEVIDNLKVNGGIRYTHDTVDAHNAVYIHFLDAPGLEPALAGVLSFQMPPQVAQAIAAATVNAQIPHGQCADYGVGGLFESHCQEFKSSFNATTWTFGASYQFSPRQLIYAKMSKGYRPGGVNSSAPASRPDLTTFAPETDTSIEIGIKSDWAIGSIPVRTNISLYTDKYQEIQQNVAVQGDGGTAGAIVVNGNDARIKGIEVEATMRPLEGLTLGVNYAYTKARFNAKNYEAALAAGDPVAATACDNNAPINLAFCPYNRFINTPTHQLGVNAHWDFIRDSSAGTFGVGGNWYYQSSTALGYNADSYLNPESVEPAYGTLNLNANWNGIFGQKLDLTLFLTNATNELHHQIITGTKTLGGTGGIGYVYNAPRMFGGTLTAHF